MKRVEVKTQAELDKALKHQKPGDFIVCLGGTWDAPLVVSDSATVRAYGSATVQAHDSATVQAHGSATVQATGSATVHAYGSATVQAHGSATVQAYDSATVRAYGSATVQAHGSATVRATGSATVHAYDSATVHAHGSATVHAYDSATVQATKYVPVQRHHKTVKVAGGIVIDAPDQATLSPAEWCAYYGVKVTRGKAIVFRAVDDDYSTSYARQHGIFYTPGSKPKCDDWNERPECGGGLHASPRPFMAQYYNEDATRYVACPVALEEIVVIDDKIKVPRIVGAVYEVDIDGERIA